MEALRKSKRGKKLGVFSKDVFHGEFMDAWKDVLKKEKMETVDVSTAAAYLMAPKEENELAIIKKACQASVDLFNKYLKEQVMEIVDADKKVSIAFHFHSYPLLLTFSLLGLLIFSCSHL